MKAIDPLFLRCGFLRRWVFCREGKDSIEKNISFLFLYLSS